MDSQQVRDRNAATLTEQLPSASRFITLDRHRARRLGILGVSAAVGYA